MNNQIRTDELYLEGRCYTNLTILIVYITLCSFKIEFNYQYVSSSKYILILYKNKKYK